MTSTTTTSSLGDVPSLETAWQFLCALPDRRARWSVNEMLFMCWTRETGVIPAALAGLLLAVKALRAT